MSWRDALADALRSVGSLRRYAKSIQGFVSRVTFLDQERASRNLDNTKKYLSLVGSLEESMRANGCSEEQIVEVVTQFKIPAVQAEMEALIISRRLQHLNASTQKKPRRVVEGSLKSESIDDKMQDRISMKEERTQSE